MISLNLVFLAFCIGGVFSALPEGLKACKQSSSDYEDCLKKEISKGLSMFKNGNKKMGIIPLDPLHFQDLVLEQGSGPVSINMKMKDVKLVGLSTSQVISVKNDWKKMMITLHIPHLHNEGDYIIKGQILILPISGSGNVSMDWDDMNYILDISLKQMTMDGKKYYQIDKIAIIISPKKVTFNFENLFNGNKELGDNMNKFLNENWEDIVKELKPAISRALEEGYRQYINRILSKIPAQDIDVK